MAPSLKHKFVTAKSNGTDVSLLRPSNWNDEHDLTLNADNLLGRATAGSGAAEEIPCTAIARTLLAGADAAAICAALGVAQSQPGDVRITLRTTAPTGWVMCNDGNIGKAGSGASTRANDDTLDLFNLLFGVVADADAPLFTSSGANTTRGAQGSAAAAWAAGCRISLTRVLGRSLAVAGSGAGITSGLALGGTRGTDTVTLNSAEIPLHTHSGTTSPMNANSSHDHGVNQAPVFQSVQNGGSFSQAWLGGLTGVRTTSANIDHEHVFTTDTGTVSGGAHNNVPPTAYFNVMVKL